MAMSFGFFGAMTRDPRLGAAGAELCRVRVSSEIVVVERKEGEEPFGGLFAEGGV